MPGKHVSLFYMKRFLLLLVSCFLVLAATDPAQNPVPPIVTRSGEAITGSPQLLVVSTRSPQARTYSRGRLARPDAVVLRKLSAAKYGQRLRAIATPTAPTFDWVALGKVPPVRDQGQCGSCWDFSGCGTATCAMIQAGLCPADGSMYFSEQFFLDCANTGGCGVNNALSFIGLNMDEKRRWASSRCPLEPPKWIAV